MYTTTPLAPIPVDHDGFMVIALAACFILIIAAVKWFDPWDRIGATFAATVAILCLGIAYFVSYVNSDQEPRVFRNTPVTGTFVRTIAEGYNEARTSGKSTRRVDVHVLYVEYEIEGAPVAFPAQTGVAYPKIATFYKN